MVFPDLSAPQAVPHSKPLAKNAIAFVADRVLALVLDFLIFSPVVSFFMAGLLRQTKVYFLLDTRSLEGYLTIAFMLGFGFALIVFLQSLFMFFLQATPGQLFAQLRVVSYPVERRRITYPQALVRAGTWSLSFLLLGIPFFEILSHPLRRAFHERASDTMVITLKKHPDMGPLPIEEKFVSSWMRLSFLFVLLFFTAYAMRSYQRLIANQHFTPGTDKLYCKEMSEDLVGPNRLDTAISLYLLGGISGECLGKEAEASLWSDPVNSQGLAYIAKYMTSDAASKKDYLQKVCADEKSTECQLGRYLAGEIRQLPKGRDKLNLIKVLSVEEAYAKRNFSGSLAVISDLQSNPLFEEAIEKKFVRSMWSLNESLSKKGRMPASSEANKWIETFKTRYDLQ